jgi:tryptophan 2,3-dioxygenase
MNYWDYIQVEKLLSLQNGLHEAQGPADAPSISNDEVLFISVHQIAELWFKLLVRELTSVRALFRKNPVPDQALASATRALRRCVTIFESATQHWRVVETLTPRDYLGFRDQLIGASGFQSAQIREVEVLLGLDDNTRLACMGEASYRDLLKNDDGTKSSSLDRVERRIAEGPSLKDALYRWLSRTPIDGSSDPAHVDAYLEQFIRAHQEQSNRTLAAAKKIARTPKDAALLEERYARETEGAARFLRAEDDPTKSAEARVRLRHIRAALVFIESHRELPRLAWPREVIETTLALEQAMIVWRQRHARMVERMIGRRTGTGGSGGVDYLDQTALKYRVFNEIWVVRGLLLRRDLVPQLKNEDDYRFRVED